MARQVSVTEYISTNLREKCIRVIVPSMWTGLNDSLGVTSLMDAIIGGL